LDGGGRKFCLSYDDLKMKEKEKFSTRFVEKGSWHEMSWMQQKNKKVH
jgi:hypothetical protein